MQTRKWSILETLSNITISLCVNFTLNALLFPAMGIQITAGQNLTVACTVTAIATVRMYFLRRLFTRLSERG